MYKGQLRGRGALITREQTGYRLRFPHAAQCDIPILRDSAELGDQASRKSQI